MLASSKRFSGWMEGEGREGRGEGTGGGKGFGQFKCAPTGELELSRGAPLPCFGGRRDKICGAIATLHGQPEAIVEPAL